VRFNDIFTPNFAFTKDFKREQLAEAIKETGCDAVLTLALLDSKTVETYHPGSDYYPVVYSPGYYSVDKTFYLETNAYDLATDKLLWSVQSEAKNPANMEEGFKQYAIMLINHLKGKGLAKK
jgi:D-alanine-D-alanine ligase-like ATP-grasp enzyme